MKNNDVVAYYSTNGFTSYTEVTVQTSAYYPNVEITSVGDAVITYIKDNVLYYRTSNTSGASWSDEAVVSDNQVNLGVRSSNLDSYGLKVYGVWEDTRGAAIDAYFDKIYESQGPPQNHPPGVPTLDGPTDLKKGKTYPYNFSATDPDGDAVEYMVEWGDSTNTGWISGTSASHSWAKGTFLIRCHARDVYGLEGGYAELEVKAPRSRLMTLRFLDLFPNAFPILRLIFGY